MQKVRPLCGQPSDRGRLKNRTEQNIQNLPTLAKLLGGGTYRPIAAPLPTMSRLCMLVNVGESVALSQHIN